ncbi:zinc finger MYND domain-containing protein 10 isoform X1 [Scleropages formosus]|uniref:zinc finger MYND domain-containing protein 10 isoform X1 n=1 Tax=Scleropages formosus TaxID=113540 RepID=UPI00087871F2|nr:zinc finger MYND domain-containing protein 10 isoform X1 [Scleropages formosus]
METPVSVLFPAEAEGYIRDLEKFPLKEVGSPRWFRQHESVVKLNMQAILNATALQDDFVQEYLVSFGKIPTLICEMILVEIWKLKVFPIICQLQDFNPKSMFPLYMVIHHEATIINLLETILFHREACEAAEESILDLVDYCHRKLVVLAGRTTSAEETAPDRLIDPLNKDVATLQDLQKQSVATDFEISLKALSVVRYITDRTDSLSLSALNRLLCTHNMPCVLVQLIEHCPWSRISNGQQEKYIDGRWHQIPKEDQLKMTKLDGQVWIALHNLLLRPECQMKYDFNNFNKSQLLKIPEIWSNIMNENSGKWKAIAKHQVKQIFNPSENDLRLQAHRLAQIYNLDVMESLIPEKPKCGSCGSEAAKRCSRCRSEWYCRRECQVKHWPKHKNVCQMMMEAADKLQKELNEKI